MQEKFLADPQAVADTYQFEQRYVTREAPGGIRFWPEPWVRHFRFHCARPLPLNFFLAPKLPRDARVVIFPGGLLPPHAIAGQWGGRYRPLTPLPTCAASSPPTAPTRRCATSATTCAPPPGSAKPGAKARERSRCHRPADRPGSARNAPPAA